MASHSEKMQRIEQILMLKAQGYRYTQIVTSACKAWGLSERQAKRYVSDAKKQEKQMATAWPLEHLGLHLNSLDYLLAKAIQENNSELALRISKERRQTIETLSKIRGKVAHEALSNTTAVSSEELAKIMAALEKFPLDE